MSLEKSRTRRGLALLVLPLLVPASAASLGLGSPVSAQTTAPTAQPAEKPPAEPHKSKRLDKHAPPWEVIWNTRLWTDVPETQDFVKETHPDPKKLDYTPLVGKDPERPKPRDAKGIAALQAELEGDIKHNELRGKAINDISALPKAAEKTTKKAAKTRKAKATKPGRDRKTVKASAIKASKAD